VSAETQWLARWFAARAARPDAGLDFELSYFDAGWIDSLGVIDLVAQVETEFDIQFEERHFQDRRFSTIAGLAAIIREIRGDRSDHAASA
jgi:D-alanine--poly(phosphoribitol) ligase subunit 2